MSYDSDEVAVKVSHVTKSYKLFDTPWQRFLYHIFHTKHEKEFKALDNISFDIKKGESFGIIGRNGSGKSTMLQILAGIINATSGEVCVNGKIAALLELGSGFNPENTGYENIYMNAAIMGVKKCDIDNKVDDIINFADIGDFINQPVKTYSSGMFIRLAFAVAINVDADILLIDEALAVGDVFFRQKCYKKMDELKEDGKTIILVSHGMNEVEQFCDRALLIDKSKQLFLGDSTEAVKYYYLLDQMDSIEEEYIDASVEDSVVLGCEFHNTWEPNDNIFWDLRNAKTVGNGKIEYLKAGSFDKDGNAKSSYQQGETCYLYIEIKTNSDIMVPLSGICLTNQKGIIVHGKDNLQTEGEYPSYIKKGQIIKILHIFDLNFEIGEYVVELGFGTINRHFYEKRMFMNQEEVNSHMERLCNVIGAGKITILEKKIGTPMKQGFHGISDTTSGILMAMK